MKPDYAKERGLCAAALIAVYFRIELSKILFSDLVCILTICCVIVSLFVHAQGKLTIILVSDEFEFNGVIGVKY
jgi:hypothetical protein